MDPIVSNGLGTCRIAGDGILRRNGIWDQALRRDGLGETAVSVARIVSRYPVWMGGK